MNSQTSNPEQAISLVPGVYRIQAAAEAFRISRSSMNRYIKRLNLYLEDIEHQGKLVKGVVLDEVSIQKISQSVNQSPTTPINQWSSNEQPIINHDQPPVNQRLIEAELQLEKHIQRNRDLEALIAAKDALIDSKQSEINTLKTSLVILERNSQDKPIELIPAQPIGLLGKIRQWFKA